MSETEQRTLTGGAAGAAGGALIGAIAGNAGLGVAIGSGTGLAGGFLVGKHEESRRAAYQQGVADGMRQAQQPVSR
jgi:osmotically inducible lipoprotein OsmB